MDMAMIFSMVMLLCLSSAYTQSSPPSPSTTMPPAPAPAPAYANLTHLFTVAGPFHTFLGYLQSTKVIETFQTQANNTVAGITIFAPSDNAFNALKKGAVSNLTQDKLKTLLLFHALQQFYSLSEFKNLSLLGPTPTFAAGSQYTLNLTDDSGTVGINTGLVYTNVTSSVYSSPNVAVYEVDRVLLPKAIFGNEIPLAPVAAPSPTPISSPTGAGSPPAPAATSTTSSPTSSPKSSSHRFMSWGIGSHLALAMPGVVVFFFF